jgi:hypothetical protein
MKPKDVPRRTPHRPSETHMKTESASMEETEPGLRQRFACCMCPENGSVKKIEVQIGDAAKRTLEGPFIMCEVMKQVEAIMQEQLENGQSNEVTVSFLNKDDETF